MDGRVRQVDVTTVQERVYRELREALYQGRFMPGEVLTIRALATALGTSSMPVREAIQRLVAENALTQLPNRTTRVASLTRATYEEWIRVRMEIEGYAAARAARHATPDVLAELRAINERFRAAIDVEDKNGMLRGNQHFHFAVYRAAESEALLRIIESLWLRFGPMLAFIRKLPGSREMFRRGADLHDRVIAAMAARDAAAARHALALDIRAAAAWFWRHADARGSAGAESRERSRD